MPSEDRIIPLAGTPGGVHLGDSQLIEAYLLAVEDPHLASCRQCRTRLDELARTLDHVRDDANRQVDALFTDERLHEQRDRIMRRLARHDHPAEVVAFPNRSARQPAMQRVFGPARRWVAAAAAAGLAAGMFLGFAMDRRMHYESDARTQPPAANTAVAWTADDRTTDFFIEIDNALMGSRSSELRAIDAMTTPVEIREASYPR